MEDTISQRVISLMKYLNFDPEKDTAKFSREIGMERPDNLYNLIKGGTGSSSKVFELITKRFENVNPAYLFWGREPMVFEAASNKELLELKNKNELLQKENDSLNKELVSIQRELLDVFRKWKASIKDQEAK